MRLRAIFIVLALSFATASHAVENYGAIAFSPQSGATGTSWDYGTLQAAENRAMQGCRKHARDCRIVTWFRNSCGAVSRGGRGGWGASQATSRKTAENNAYVGCRKHDQNCKIISSVCSSR